jgi:hypothetical protein
MLPLNTPEYPVKEQLPEITDHNNLPPGAVELARVENIPDDFDLLMFVKNKGHLSILDVRISPRYFCFQDDFPLEFLSWFPDALDDFRRPPAEGGLPAGVMTTEDVEVGGEMLCIQRAIGIGGYSVVNRSRCKRDTIIEGDYEPHEIDFTEQSLYNDGLLDLIRKLGVEQG